MKTIKTFKNKLVEYVLTEVHKNIFAVQITDAYDRAMLFLRYQEFYESPFDEFRGKHFDVFEYMKHYTLSNQKESFTYTEDWSGYNIPSHSIEACMCGITQYNSYDFIFKDIYFTIRSETKEPFYILGVDDFDSIIMDHEVAHGLFYTNQDYKSEMLYLCRKIPNDIKNKMSDILTDMGYCFDVIPDEVQAYMATGLTPEFERIEGINLLVPEFQDIFKKYN